MIKKGGTKKLLLAATLVLSSGFIFSNSAKAETLAEALENPNTSSYEMTDNFTFSSNAPELTGINRNLSILGQNLYSISGGGFSGITVSNGQTLKLQNINNITNFVGAAITNSGTLEIQNVNFTANGNDNTTASIDNISGGAIFTSGNLDIKDTIFDNNTSSGYGGAIYTIGNTSSEDRNYSIKGTISDLNGNITSTTMFTDNKAQSSSALYITSGTDTTGLIDGVIFRNNLSQTGNVININGGTGDTHTIKNSIFELNGFKSDSTMNGSSLIGLYGGRGSYLEIDNSKFINNSSGILETTSDFTIKNSLFKNNEVKASVHKPIIFLGGVTGKIIDSNIINNKSNVIDIRDYEANPAILNITAETEKGVEISGNSGYGIQAKETLNSESVIKMYAKGGDILVENNTNGGIYIKNENQYYSSVLPSLILNADSKHKLTINDSITYKSYDNNANNTIKINDEGNSGEVILNGALDIHSGMDISGGVLSLGTNAVTSDLKSVKFSNTPTLNIQNKSIDNLNISSISGTVKLNVDYDATENKMDKLTINSGSGSIILNAVNVVNDNENFVDGTTTEYLDGTARDNVTVISDAVQSTVAGTTVYTFTPDSTTHGLLTVSRGIVPYAGDLINAIQDNVGTSHPTAYSMQSDFTANRNFGALNTENRDEFTIFGNNHTISGDNTYTGIEVASGQTLKLQNINNITNFVGAAITNSGTLEIQNVNFTANGNDITTASIDNMYGGAVLNSGTITELKGNFTNNSLLGAGGALYNSGIINTITNTTFDGNKALNKDDTSSSGGAIYNNETIGGEKGEGIKNSLFNNNTAFSGGAIYNKGDILISDTDFTNNTANASGGAVYNKGNITISDANFTGNSAASKGAAIYNTDKGTVNLTNTVFSNNKVDDIVNDIANEGILNLSGLNSINVITGSTGTTNIMSGTTNIAKDGSVTQNAINLQGGRLYVYLASVNSDIIADKNYSSTYITSGSDDAKGGALRYNGIMPTIKGTFKGNTAKAEGIGSAYGGAIFHRNSESLTLDSVIFKDNLAESENNDAYCGAADLGANSIVITNSQFDGNKVNSKGLNSSAIAGAIGVGAAQTLSITNTSFTNNSATSASGNAYGGAVYKTGKTLTIKDSSFTGNKAANGGAIYGKNADVTIYAQNRNVEFTNNNSTGLVSGTGNGIEIEGGSLTLNADKVDDTVHTVTINDAVSSTVGMTVNSDNNSGSVVLNGALTLGGDTNIKGGTLKLGTSAAGSTFKNVSFTNTPTLDLQNTNADTLVVDKITGNSNLNIDVNSATSVSDAIQIATTGSSGTLTVNSLSFLDDVTTPESFNINVITKGAEGDISGITLAISSALAEEYSGTPISTDYDKTYTYNSNITFDTTKFTTEKWTKTTQKQLTVVNSETAKGLKLNVNEISDVHKQDGEGHYSYDTNYDALQVLNQHEGERTLTADGATATSYTVGDNLCTTASGTLNVTGKSDGSNLDMNNNTGFVVSNADTTLNLTNLNITNINDTQDGVLINLTGTGSKANLENVIISNTANSAILNDVELNLNGTNNLGTGITGTGRTKVNGGKTILTKLVQNDVNINNGAELEISDLKLANSLLSNNGILTIKSNHSENEGKTLEQLENAVVGEIYPWYITQDYIDYDVTGNGITNFKSVGDGSTTNISSNIQTAINVGYSDFSAIANLNIINRDETGSAIKFGSTGKDINIYGSAVRIGKNVDIEGSLKLYSDIDTTGDFPISKRADVDIYSAESIKADVENAGLLAIYNGTLNKNIINTAGDELLNKYIQLLPTPEMATISYDNTTYLPGMVIMTGTNNAKIDATILNIAKITHPLYKYGDKNLLNDTFITNASDVTTKYGIDNRGTLVLTGGTNKNYIGTFNLYNDGTRNVIKEFEEKDELVAWKYSIGKVQIKGDVINEAQIDNAINVQSGSLTTSADYIGNTINNTVNEGLILTGGELKKTVTGDGSTLINTASTVTLGNDGEINQAVTVKKGKLIADVSKITNVTNNATVELTGTGNLAQNITKNTVIAGDITTGDKTLENVSVNNGSVLTTSVDKVTGTIANSGTLNLSGDLNKTVSGDGTTIAQTNMILGSNAGFVGKFDLNGKNFTMSGDKAATTFNVGTLDGSGNLSIDLLNNGTSIVSDAINATNYTSGKTITVTTLNDLLGDNLKSFTLNVLQGGDTTGVTLALDSSITDNARYKTSVDNKQKALDLKQNSSWDDKFGTENWTETIERSLNVDGGKIVFTQSDMQESAHTITADGDTLVALNQNIETGFTNRSFVTDNAEKTYTLIDNLGSTGTGTLTVKGATDGTNTSTLNMNGNTGFVVDKNTTVNLDTVKITGTANSDGSLINNTKGTVNLNNVEVTANESNIIANESKLTVENSTIKTGITGTGSTTVKGDSLISKITQKAVEILTGSKLETQTISATDGITNAGELTVNGNSNTSDIKGNGTLIVNGNMENSGNIENAITVNSGKSLQSSADKIKNTVANEGTYTLTDGTIAKDITGNGSTVIDGSVTNSAKISNAVTINSDKDLTSNANNITNTIANNGDYNVTGGTITKAVTGAGNTNIQGDTTVKAAIAGNVNVAGSTKLTVDSSTPLTGAAKIALANGSTLDISGDTSTGNTYNNISVASGTANLMLDWGDVVKTDNITGKLNISSIDLTATTSTTPMYSLATGSNLNNISVAKDVNLITNDTSFNTVKYKPVATEYNPAGALIGSRSDLIQAVNKTEPGESVIYSMSTNEKAGTTSPGLLDGGTLIVQGNGNTIKDEGIIVGDGVNSADLTLKDTNMNIETGNALLINNGSNVTLQAENNDMTINGNIISTNVNNTLTIASGSTVNHAGLLDPLTTEVNGTYNRTSGYDAGITFNVNNGGVLKYSNDTTLYDSGFHDGSTGHELNTMNLNGGTLDTRNGVVTDFQLANFNVNANSNVMLDVDLANKKMDNFDNSTISVTGGAKLNISALNLISDATSDNTQVKFTSDTNLIGNVNYTGSAVLTALSPIYKYNVSYDDTDGANGYFNFARFSSGGHNDFNPAILPTPIAAQLGGYLIQLNSYDEAFRNMDMYMLMTKDERQAMKLRNKYADLNAAPVYDETKAISENAAGWFRPFVNFESVGLKNGPKVKNNIYGTFAGFDSGITELSNGWDGMWGIYAGYNGSHQHYDGIGIYQNGGTLGLTGMLYKDNFFTGLTANVGANLANASTMYGSEDFGMLMTGVASKTGYNWELAEGKFIIQPNYQMSYSMVNTFDYTNSAGVRVKSDPLHAITFEPGVKFIGNLPNGWQPYAGISMVWNVLDKTDVKANDVSLPNMSVKPFVKYGVGVRKTWGERLTGFIQTFITNGGRNGIGFQAGFKWFLGKENPSKTKKSQNKMLEKVQTKVNLKNI